ncbi:hypothetical protein ACFVAJ_03400 [Agromyces sp. NPDC057679]|uniref:hypothetical protein n=1 Tax=Agromyces sp. NPDC057679 TaxID=3346207 RepID=UPI00366F8681
MAPDPKLDAAVRDIDAYARSLHGGLWWATWVSVGVVGVAAAGAGFSAGESGVALGLTGILAVIVALVLTWFESQQAARIRTAKQVAPAAAVMPFVVTARLAHQLDSAGKAVGRRAPYVPYPGYGLLVVDSTGVRVFSGWAFATEVAIPSTAIEDVALGTIEYSFGVAQSVDLLMECATGPVRVSFQPMRVPTRFFGVERPEIIAGYVEALRTASRRRDPVG